MGEPPEPVASLATVTVTRPAMRRCASAWAVGLTTTSALWLRTQRHQMPNPKITSTLSTNGQIRRRWRRLAGAVRGAAGASDTPRTSTAPSSTEPQWVQFLARADCGELHAGQARSAPS